MQSFLTVAKNSDEASSYISDLLAKNEVNPLDIAQQIYEKAVGIEDVRNIQKATLLKPFRGRTKAVVIDASTNITIEAQNALLKILEEPPANTLIIITVSNKDLILPTIISRCKVIILQEKVTKLAENETLSFQSVLETLISGKIGDRLKIAQDITKDKGDGALWLEKMSIFLEEKIKQGDRDPKLSSLLRELQETYKAVKSTNVGQRAALENLFLSF